MTFRGWSLPHPPRLRWPGAELRQVPPLAAPGRVLGLFRRGPDGDLGHHHSGRERGASPSPTGCLWVSARHHGLSGFWAPAFPLQIDTFIVVGELALFIAMVDQWERRHKAGACAVTLLGLVASVAGDIGHVAGHDLRRRGCTAVGPGRRVRRDVDWVGVLKRVIAQAAWTAPDDDVIAQEESIREAAPLKLVSDVVSSPVPSDTETAAAEALRAFSRREMPEHEPASDEVPAGLGRRRRSA